MDNRETVLEAARFLDEKKAGNVVVIRVGQQTTITDYFIIADSEVQLQLDSLKSLLLKHLHEKGLVPRNNMREGQSGWVLIDYNDFVVHLFLRETRDFYKLETIWGECELVWPRT